MLKSVTFHINENLKIVKQNKCTIYGKNIKIQERKKKNEEFKE